MQVWMGVQSYWAGMLRVMPEMWLPVTTSRFQLAGLTDLTMEPSWPRKPAAGHSTLAALPLR